MAKSTSSPIAQGALFAILGFALFATHDAIIKSFDGKISVVQILFFSNIFAFPWVAFMVMGDERHMNFRPNHLLLMVLRTLLGLASGGFAFYAFMNLPLADVYGLLFTSPLLITIFAVPFLGEKLGLVRLGAVLLGFVGVIVMLPKGGGSLGLGHASALMAALCGSLNAIVTRKIGGGERDAVMIMLPLLISISILTVLLPSGYAPLQIGQLYKLIAIGGIAFCAQLAIVNAFKRADAAVVAPMQYSQLIWAILFGALFFDEEISSQKLIGAAIIIASGLIILYREVKGPNSTQHPTSSARNYRPGVLRNLGNAKER